jgi:hypothetical protein
MTTVVPNFSKRITQIKMWPHYERNMDEIFLSLVDFTAYAGGFLIINWKILSLIKYASVVYKKVH